MEKLSLLLWIEISWQRPNDLVENSQRQSRFQPFPVGRRQNGVFVLSEPWISILDRTSGIRRKTLAKKLFVSCKQDFSGEMATQTISWWVSQAVKWAYLASSSQEELIQLHQVNCHEVRALAVSVAFSEASTTARHPRGGLLALSHGVYVILLAWHDAAVTGTP